ncbi:retrovirus-related pol polyprotein from transposon TNT 1-94 [Tanacetum coccineum]
MIGHTIERCYETIGYPTGFKKFSNPIKQNGFNKQNFNANVDFKNNNKQSSTSVSSSGFTSKWMQKLLSLINDNTIGSGHAYMAGANQHLTVSTIWMFDVVDITILKITIGHPNGTLATISHAKNLKLSNNVVLYDVLVVPVYCLLWHNTLGHPSNQVLSVLQSDLSIIKNCYVPVCEVFHKEKQTRDPFTLSDHKSKGLGELIDLDMRGPYKTAVYLVNRLPTSVLNGNSPFEMVHKKKPYLSYLSSNDEGKASSIVDGSELSFKPDTLDTAHNIVSSPRNIFHPNVVQTHGPRRSNRQSKLSAKLNDCVINSSSVDPSCYEDAMCDNNWIAAMNSEIKALNRNNTWTVCDLPVNKKAIGQRKGLDYKETLSPVVKMVTVRCLISIAVNKNWPLFYPTVEEDGQTRPKKYSELTEAQQIQDDCDVQATNIILHGLPPDVYALVNHQEPAKDIWDRVKLLKKGIELSYQEREYRLYNLFDKFTYVQGETFLVVPTFRQGEDLIDCLNKAMSFLFVIASSSTSSRKTNSEFCWHWKQRNYYNFKGNYAASQHRVVKCYNCQGEWHMARQCTQPKRPRNSASFKEKLMLVKAQEASQILDEEQLAFLADPGIHEALCDDLSSAKAVLMANLSSCDLDVLSEKKESLSKTLTVFKTESKEKESKNIDKEIVLEKQNKELENIICKMYRSMQVMHMLTKPQVFYNDTHKQALGYQNPFHLKKAQRIKPPLYDGSVIAKEHAVISMIDDEETLILEEESRSKMLDKQNDPISIEKKINISPIDYSKIEAPSELPKVSLVNKSLKKLKYHLAGFDKVVKKRSTSNVITAGAWGFEHTKACFVTEIIPFLKVLKDTFNAFDKTLLDETTKVKTVFNQMEAAVDQCSVDKNDLEIKIKQLSIDNDQLLNQIMSQEIMHIAVNSVDILDVNKSHVDECIKCLELETELLKKKDFIEKDVYDKLVKSYSTLEKH